MRRQNRFAENFSERQPQFFVLPCPVHSRARILAQAQVRALLPTGAKWFQEFSSNRGWKPGKSDFETASPRNWPKLRKHLVPSNDFIGEAIFSGTIEMFERHSVFTVLLIEQPCQEVVNAFCRYEHHARTTYCGAS